MDASRKISDLAPEDVPIVERLFGRRLDNAVDAVLILRLPEATPPAGADGLPDWCNVLEGMSDEDVDDFNTIMKLPVKLGHREA
jgi:hypothetical protein